MAASIVIALDIMGGDHGPAATVPGALLAASAGIDVTLVGDERSVGADLLRRVHEAGMRLVDTPEAVAMEEKAAGRVRGGARTSLYVAAELIKTGTAEAMVSMGNTGGGMATALGVLGRLPGVERPALGVVLPGGPKGTLLLDAGANANARPSHLLQFAILGATFMRAVNGVAAPRVALLSIGEEASKGSTLVVEAHRMLAGESGLDFVGNVEGRHLLAGRADVIVTDGFTGNVSVKLIEGVAPRPFQQIRAAAASSLLARLGAALLARSLRDIRDELSARRYGAVPLLGVNGGVFIGHGSSDAETIARAIGAAHEAVERGMLSAFAAALSGGER